MRLKYIGDIGAKKIFEAREKHKYVCAGVGGVRSIEANKRSKISTNNDSLTDSVLSNPSDCSYKGRESYHGKSPLSLLTVHGNDTTDDKKKEIFCMKFYA